MRARLLGGGGGGGGGTEKRKEFRLSANDFSFISAGVSNVGGYKSQPWYNWSYQKRVPGEIKRREVELDPHFAQKRSWAGRRSWAAKVGLLSLRVVPTAVQRTLWLCPSTAAETAIAQCTSRCAMARGHRTLTLPLFWRRSTVSPVFFRALSAVEAFTLSVPFPPPPPLPSPSLISNIASADVKQQCQGLTGVVCYKLTGILAPTKNCVSWRFFQTYGVTSYGSG